MAMLQNYPASSSPAGVSKLSLIQARFQQRQQEEKEQKLFNMLEQQHETFPPRAPVMVRHNSNVSSANSFTSSNGSSLGSSLGSTGTGGKVRQMFDERRQQQNNGTTKSRPPMIPVNSGPLKSSPNQTKSSPTKGYDRRYPLEPLPSASRKRGISLERPGDSKTTDELRRSRSQYQVFGNPEGERNVMSQSLIDSNHNVAKNRENKYGSGAKLRSPSESRTTDRRNINNTSFCASSDEIDYGTPARSRTLQDRREAVNENVNLKAMEREQKEMTEKLRKLQDEKQRIELEAKKREQELLATIRQQQAELQRLKQAAILAETKAKASAASAAGKKAAPYDSDDSRSDETISSASSNGWVPFKPSVKPALEKTVSPAITSSKKTSKSTAPWMKPESAADRTPPTRAGNNNNNGRQSIFSTAVSALKDGLVACAVCGRHFAPDRVEKHQTVCAKNSAKKRKVFDVTKMRVKGTEAEAFVLKKPVRNQLAARQAPRAVDVRNNQPANQQRPIAQQQDDKPAWKKKHESFLETIRAAKAMQKHLKNGGNIADLPPPPPSDTSDYIQCQHCGRRFSPGAADRHIPKCASILSNKTRR